ncbi:MAG: hydrogenase expression/formation protein HypE [Candidatus Omnitrophica bacterium]|nr:hydrogenase expression/formation protein HypE [Candidatus Omnitrophota bacterium]
MTKKKEYNLPSCPILISDYPRVLLAHGSGGTLTNQLIDKMFRSVFNNDHLNQSHDGAVVQIPKKKIAMTTDSYVIDPIFFPGGDIGSLAVHGTVNDLSMCGARPIFLTVGFILEEGLPMEDLWRVVQSMQKAAKESNVQIISGDTKVVDKGKADRIFVNTSGVGVVEHNQTICPSSIKDGDCIILSGDIARHGMAIMAVREGLSFENKIKSDSASLSGLVLKLIESKATIHCMRDLTRGGLATALVEIAKTSNMSIEIDEQSIPVREDVRGVCEILGIDPLYVANEGRFICFVPESQAKKVLATIKMSPLGRQASIIGYVSKEKRAMVTAKNQIGTTRIVDMLSSEQLPRIC